MALKLGKIFKKVVKIGAPIVGGVLGGPAGAALGGALGGAVGGGKPKLGNILGGAATGYVGGKLLQGGGSGILGKVFGGGGAPGVAGAAPAAGGGGVLGRVFGGVGKYGPDLLQAGIAGYGALEGAKQARAGDRLQQQALNMAQQQYAEGAPLRARQRQLLLQGAGARPDLSYAYRSTESPFG